MESEQTLSTKDEEKEEEKTEQKTEDDLESEESDNDDGWVQVQAKKSKGVLQREEREAKRREYWRNRDDR